MTLTSYKYRMYPNQKQREYFAKVFGCVRFVYNKMLDDSNKYYELEGKRLLTNPSSYKKDFPFLKEVDNSALANAKMNLDHAFNKFFKKKANYPVYKSKKDKYCSYSTNMLRNNIRIEGSYIRLPKIKLVRIRMHRNFSGTIKKATISKTPSGDYFVSLLVETEIMTLPVTDTEIGIDMGVSNIITDSNGKTVENARPYDRLMKKIAREDRRLKRKTKGGRNREKQRIRLAKAYRKITNIRTDFLHKVSRKIIDENQVIVCEDLVVTDMMGNKLFNRDIMDSSWSKLTDFIKYKSELYGRTFIKVGKYYPSSQICSSCGFRNEEIKGINIKMWTCPQCGDTHQRDVNAAKNILREGKRLLKIIGESEDGTIIPELMKPVSGVLLVDVLSQ